MGSCGSVLWIRDEDREFEFESSSCGEDSEEDELRADEIHHLVLGDQTDERELALETDAHATNKVGRD